MVISQELKQALAEKIIFYIKQEFAQIYFSHSLADTVKIDVDDDGKVTVEIPAPVYDIDLYKKKKQLVYKGTGSYAEEVNVKGGFSGKHVGYAERAVSRAISDWMKENNLEGRLR